MVERNPKLKKINLRHCKYITDEAVRHIVDNCLDLEELFLGFTSITDVALDHLSRRSITIEIDQCQGCSKKRFGQFNSTDY